MKQNIGANFNHSDLSAQDLRGEVFIKCTFNSCNFSRANLRDATFIKCTINNCIHDNTNLTNTHYDCCNFQRSSFNTVISHAIFTPSAEHVPSLDSLRQAKLTRIYLCITRLLEGLSVAHMRYILGQINHGNITGKQYHTEFAECITKMIADFKGCEIKDLGDSAVILERFLLSVNAGDTPETNPVLTILSDYLTILITEEAKMDFKVIQRSAARQKFGGRATVLDLH